ncbi:MAG: DUF5058 family protein [Candidatus Moduliflexus flocculans]|nr:DUF5058 family protein [Candidatus Moduliflexus flocculans]
MAASLGIAWPWFRLSVIGSVSYELMAANMASSALGFAEAADASKAGPEPLGAIMYAMTGGLAGAIILDILFIKKVDSLAVKMKAKAGSFRDRRNRRALLRGPCGVRGALLRTGRRGGCHLLHEHRPDPLPGLPGPEVQDRLAGELHPVLQPHPRNVFRRALDGAGEVGREPMEPRAVFYRGSTGSGGSSFAIFFVLMFAIPTVVCAVYDIFPSLATAIKATMGLFLILTPIALSEIVSFVPLLGSGASYLTFETGNVSNIKLPCAMNALKLAGVQPASEEGEVLSTISVAISSIVTTAVILAAALLLSRPGPGVRESLGADRHGERAPGPVRSPGRRVPERAETRVLS